MLRKNLFLILTAAALLVLTALSASAATPEEQGYRTAPDQYICPRAGDVDSDGKIDAGDARLTLRMAVGLDSAEGQKKYRADTDGDGKVTSADARMLLRYSVGLERGLSHTKLETVTFEPATCFTTGSCADLCAHCGKLFNFAKLPEVEHFAAGWDTLEEATCAREGLCELRCIFCDTIMDTKLIPKTNHVFGETQYETAPDCFHYVNTRKVCTVCGFTERSAEAPAGAHTFVWETVQAPTCTEDGVSAETCAHCGYASGKTQILKNAGGHTDAEWRTARYPNCTEEGLRTKTCRRCKEIYATETLAPLGHDKLESSYKLLAEPDCENDGSAEYFCLRCSQTVTLTLEAKGHVPAETPVRTAPTCTENGSIAFTCSECGKDVEIAVPATGHTPGEWEGPVEAEDGFYFIRRCIVCEEELERSEKYD